MMPLSLSGRNAYKIGILSITFLCVMILGLKYSQNEAPAVPKVTRQDTWTYRNISTNEVKLPEVRTVHISECSCSKTISQFKELPSNWSYAEEDSTCSSASYMRGPGQKIVAYSYFHPSDAPDLKRDNKFGRKYFQGIRSNLQAIQQYYPGYAMRLYFRIGKEFTSAWEALCQLACEEEFLDICQMDLDPEGPPSFISNMLKKKGIETNMGRWPMTWRFLPNIDPTVDMFFSRDLDSLPAEREKAAVDEFIKADNALFHVMRDHPDHGAVILGGTWGTKVAKSRDILNEKMLSLFKSVDSQHDVVAYDQSLMRSYVWPWAKRVVMAHNSYHCKIYKEGSRPFPTMRLNATNNFIGGSPYGMLNLENKRARCPEPCRPRDHKDWIFC